ncbi:MAG: universal stress protein [Cyanobacteria bacterium J06555_13]
MFSKILVALDPLESDNGGFEKALSLAQAMGAELKILSVLTAEVNTAFMPPELGPLDQAYSLNDWSLFQESYQLYEKKNAILLKSLSDRAIENGVSTEFTQISGNPGKTICTLASTWNAGLIIVGSHQRKGLSEMLLGSISSYVVHHAPCSVLVIHEPR